MNKIVQKYTDKLDSLEFADSIKMNHGTYKGFWKNDLPFGPSVFTWKSGNFCQFESNENGQCDG